MRVLTLAAGTALLASAAKAQSRGEFEFHRDLATGKRFVLQNIIGNVRVTGGSGRTVEVTATKRAGRHGDPEDVTIETVELKDGVALCVRYPQSSYHRHADSDRDRNRARDEDRNDRDDGDSHPCNLNNRWNGNGDRNDTEVSFTVRVPAGLRLDLGTVSGDLVAEHLEGDLDLRSVSGDVSLTGGQGPEIQLGTVSGTVTLDDVHARTVGGQTVSGDVTFKGPILDGGDYDFATTSGDIRMTLPEKPNATLSAATFSGRFSSDLPTNQDDRRRHRTRFSATWGSGSAKLGAESLSGDILIRVSH